MAGPPRDMSDAPGLGPLSPPGPAQPIEHVRGDVLALLSDRAKAIVIGQGMDYITKMQQCGASDHSLTMLRGMLRRMTRAMYLYETHAAVSAVDFDPTQQ